MTKIKLAKEEDNADQGGHIQIFYSIERQIDRETDIDKKKKYFIT